jgi:hypothetical protein
MDNRTTMRAVAELILESGTEVAKSTEDADTADAEGTGP